ncbi:MAG: efflux RND transporter periplasmic adaptor subunit [Byssovorax sp.]
MRPTPFAVLLLALALAAGGPACGNKGSAQEAPEAKPKLEPGVDVELTQEAQEAARIKVAPARVATRGGALTAQGTLALSPKRVAKIGSLVDGRVSAVRVQPGDRVKVGEALASIESAAIGRARADYFQAQARLRHAEDELRRDKALVGNGAVSERTVTKSQTERDVAAFEARAASERLRAVGVDPGTSGERTGNGVSLTAPLAGVVLDARARVGEAVAPADTLFTVGDLAELWLMIEVYERDLAKVRPGEPVRVTTVAVPDRIFEGRVDHVMETIDPARRAADVRVILPNADGMLRPGMSATARIALGDAPPAASGAPAASAAPAPSAAPLASASAMAGAAPEGQVVIVPRGALQGIDGLMHVFVEKGERKYELRAVEIGPAYEGEVEVLRGLAAGERVVVEGSFILKSQVLREQMGSND